MHKLIVSFLFLCLLSFTTRKEKKILQHQKFFIDTIPAYLLGNFMDDYGIRYNVTGSLWLQKPGIKYHIIKWNVKEQFIIAQNDDNNPGEKGLYSRIDYMRFNNMEPFLWGFCLAVYNAKSDSLAESATAADRENPRKGCNGFPFSRMKRIVP
ncbi:MAG: hypothetical protein ABI741_16320 [Ferruginibacter sp.]